MPLAQTFVLPDSRLLSYDDLGDPAGVPVIFFHGVPGSRRYWAFTGPEDIASEKGVRLVSPDRPGIGRSSPAPHRLTTDIAQDVARLADHLGLERFAVLSFSGGSAYALATAALLPDRVAAVALMSPVADLSMPAHLAGLDPLSRNALRAVAAPRSHPWRVPDRFDAAKLLALGANRAWALLPSADRRALALPRVKQAATGMLEEAARHGLEGVHVELSLMIAPWDFGLGDVRVPVDLHVGSADPWSTAEMVHWLRVGLRSPRVRTYAGGGHFTVLVQHAGDVLDGLLERAELDRTRLVMARGS